MVEQGIIHPSARACSLIQRETKVASFDRLGRQNTKQSGFASRPPDPCYWSKNPARVFPSQISVGALYGVLQPQQGGGVMIN